MENRIFEDEEVVFQSSRLIGLGFDHEDGHRRITTSERFSIVGGSESTHGRLTAIFIKALEDLDRQGKNLSELEPEELGEILTRHCS